ncbi:MAG: homoserine O-acetyltransferase [Crocinitomicaceae bacterium]|nr:homoserine O-acetyltransferase [Crocinitomicaceae bacterium]
MSLKYLYHNEAFPLESGESLEGIKIAYQTWGNLDKSTKKVIWVCHALTGSADVFDWWSDLFGADKLFNPSDYFIVCANVLGSHYGSTGPLSKKSNGNKFYHSFPAITTLDMVRAHEVLRKYLGIEQIHLLIGASLGGQQAIQWAVEKPEIAEQLALIATNAQHSPYGIAFNETQRMAIQADQSFKYSYDYAGLEGLKAARAIAMLSYRSASGYLVTQSEDSNEKADAFKASSYQRYQGEKFVKRFNAFSYWTLSKAMDSHNVFRNHPDALKRIQARTLCIGITTDLLFPVSEQKFLNEEIEDSIYVEIESEFGHDGFLVEGKQLEEILKDFLNEKTAKYKPTIFKQKHLIVA